MNLITVSNKRINSLVSWNDRFYVLRSNLLDPFTEVIASPVEGFHQGTMTDYSIGSHHKEVVGHIRRSN